MIGSLIENTVSDMKTKGHIRTLQYDICKPISLYNVNPFTLTNVCPSQEMKHKTKRYKSFCLGKNY